MNTKVIDINKHKEERKCLNCIYHDAKNHACKHPNYQEIIMKSKSHCVGFTDKE